MSLWGCVFVTKGNFTSNSFNVNKMSDDCCEHADRDLKVKDGQLSPASQPFDLNRSIIIYLYRKTLSRS